MEIDRANKIIAEYMNCTVETDGGHKYLEDELCRTAPLYSESIDTQIMVWVKLKSEHNIHFTLNMYDSVVEFIAFKDGSRLFTVSEDVVAEDDEACHDYRYLKKCCLTGVAKCIEGLK